MKFAIGDFKGDDEPIGETVPVAFTGIVPDMFAEGRDVIIEGRYVDGTLHAQQIMTSCPSKYEAASAARRRDAGAARRRTDGRAVRRMIDIGPLAINLAFVLAAYAVVMSLVGVWRGGATSSPAPSTPCSPSGARARRRRRAAARAGHPRLQPRVRRRLQQQHAAALLHRRRAVGRAEGLAALLAADPHLDQRGRRCCRTATRTAS